MPQDIIERLDKWYNKSQLTIEEAQTLYDAIIEIKRLRALAGAVSAGESFAELREKAR